MRLRRVTLTGFKTFARHGEIVLDPGLTAVVGPNGSGKSNLVDAIRWALGETNARELRGARMDQVIYAGGQGRAPMGMAQVELVLDNEEGRLPLEDAEVCIARRVTRGGDSEYRLNGARVRLRDLERTLSATGLTQNGYAVVAQNDVDGIIEASPQQRRSLVEEAAGVRGLRAAREDGMNRVAAVETRLLRLADLLADAEPRLDELEAQAAVATEHHELAARLAELRGSLAREEWRGARALMRRAKQRLLAADSRAEAAAAAEAEFNERLDAARAALTVAREAQAAASQRLEGARLAAERANGDRRRWVDRAMAAILQRATSAAEAQAGLVDVADQRRVIAELGDAGMAAESMLQGLESRNTELRRGYDDAEARLNETGRRLAEAQEDLAVAEGAVATTTAALREHSVRAELLEESTVAVQAEAETARQRVAELRARTSHAAEEAAGRQRLLVELLEGIDAAREGALRSRAELRRLEEEEAHAHNASREAGARLAAVRGQLSGALGGDGLVARAIAAGRLRGGRLLEHVRAADPADQPAIEAALEDHLAAWLVDDLAAAEKLLAADAVREEVLGENTTPPAGVPAPFGVRSALEAVVVDEAARGAVAHCLSRVWLAPDVEAARRAVTGAGGRAVLPDGTIAGPAGMRGGGRPGATLALVAAEREAQLEADTAASSEKAAQQRTEAARKELAQVESEAAALTEKGETARVAAAEAAAHAAGTITESEAAERQVSALQTDLAGRIRGIAAARESVVALADELGASESRVAGARAEAATAREATEATQAAVDEAWARLRDHELDSARAEPEARETQRRLVHARQALVSAEQRVFGAEIRLLVAEETAVVAVARQSQTERLFEASEAEVEMASLAVERAAVPLAADEAAVAALATERTEVAVSAARAVDEQAAAEAELLACQARVNELAEAVREDEVDDGPEPEADTAERAEREITRLERRIGALGPVNALAPEQYDRLEERVRMLRRDHDDLAVACIDLRLLATHLSTEIERRFDAVFGAAAYHFRMVFEELFPGGRATLRLQEPSAVAADEEGASEAVLEPGVEILAQPAGKRLQALSLLSGGERALTALAVILALQQVNPSPFYVFDEVDAPLDDANIGRFTRLLKRLATTQQFLVITHNHATMAAAEALYGVTLESDGTSRLLSVRLVGGEPVAHPREAAVAAL